LEQNYRSTKTILAAAQQIISANTMRKDKHLWTDCAQGTPIMLHEAYNEQEEASYVVTQIDRLMANEQYKLSDFAVMYRVNAQSRAIEDAFRRRGMPYKLVGTKFYDRKEIKDVLAYLRFIYNPFDTAGMLRIINVPTRAIGQKTVDELVRWASRIGITPIEALRIVKYGNDTPSIDASSPFSGRAEQALIDFVSMYEDLYQASTEVNLVELIELVLKRTGYADFVKDGSEEGLDRWDNIHELATVAQDYINVEPRTGLGTFLEEIALVADADEYDAGSEAVTMITLHAAKGLEFPVVFMVGMEDGICPHQRSFDDTERMEEERRLCYVGITRAKERLSFTYAFTRRMMGSTTTGTPSRYLAEIPGHLVQGKPEKAAAEKPIGGGSRSGFGGKPAGVSQSKPFSSAKPAFVKPEAARSERKSAAAASFQVGDRVRHAKFGDGIVLESHSDGDDESVVVLFSGAVGRKTLALSFAKLEKLV
jgi:DNA helicase-2/ATP-dependent DNA helicase PcrA